VLHRMVVDADPRVDRNGSSTMSVAPQRRGAGVVGWMGKGMSGGDISVRG
jgi:hypothetical protein